MDVLNDIFTLEEAAAFLKVPVHRLGYAVISGDLPCGVIARNWTGIAIPKRNDIPRGEKGHRWTNQVVDILDHDKAEYLYEYRLTGTDISYRIRKACLGHFWYLHHTNAYHLFAVARDGIDVQFLEPVDGGFNHRTQPDRYCEPDFIVFIDDDSPNRHVTLQDLLFLRRDLEKLRATDTSKPLHESERKSLLALIRALAELHGIKSGNGAYRKEASAVLQALAEKGMQAEISEKTIACRLKDAFKSR